MTQVADTSRPRPGIITSRRRTTNQAAATNVTVTVARKRSRAAVDVTVTVTVSADVAAAMSDTRAKNGVTRPPSKSRRDAIRPLRPHRRRLQLLAGRRLRPLGGAIDGIETIQVDANTATTVAAGVRGPVTTKIDTNHHRVTTIRTDGGRRSG